jgi:hypothetical protein
MYNLKNYLLSMQSHWMINQPLYQSVQDSLPQIAKFRARNGTEDLEKLEVSKHIKKVFPDVHRVPLLRRQYCKMLVEEIREMQKAGLFETNPNEDVLRQIPEITLHDMVPELYRTMWFIVQNVLNPISSIQLANYNVKDKKQGAWHHDESSDMSVVVPLNTGEYEGGGTEFHGLGTLKPLPTGHALIFPSFTKLHRGLPVHKGDRFLLVFWLHNRSRTLEMKEMYQ